MTRWPQRNRTTTNWFFFYLLLLAAASLVDNSRPGLSDGITGISVLWLVWSAGAWVATRVDQRQDRM